MARPPVVEQLAPAYHGNAPTSDKDVIVCENLAAAQNPICLTPAERERLRSAAKRLRRDA